MIIFANTIRTGVRTFLYISVLLMFSFSGVQAQNQKFFETLYDVPVMEGLEEVPEMALSFDKVGGRIAEAGAIASDLSDREVIAFYKLSLEQMGWWYTPSSYDPYIFTREGEELKIFLEKSSTSPVIRFLLEPTNSVKP